MSLFRLRYRKELGPEGIQRFSLVAEEVEKVDPDLETRDAKGEAYTVRYDAVIAMLINGLLTEHRTVEEQGVTIKELKSAIVQQKKDFQATAAQQQKQIEALTAGLQKVSAQVDMSKPAPQMIVENR